MKQARRTHFCEGDLVNLLWLMVAIRPQSLQPNRRGTRQLEPGPHPSRQAPFQVGNLSDRRASPPLQHTRQECVSGLAFPRLQGKEPERLNCMDFS